MTQPRILTQAEADLLQFIYDYRKTIYSFTAEEVALLLDLSREFARPTPTCHKAQRAFWLSPITRLLEDGAEVTKESLRKALEGML